MSSYFQSKSHNILFLILFASATAKSATYSTIESAQPTDNKTLEQKLISGNVEISKWFEGIAEGIDLFLVDKQLKSARNETSVKIENSTYAIEGSGVTNGTSLIVNPRFPNLEKYWNLKFTTYDEFADDRGSDKSYLRQAPPVKNYGAAIGLFRKFGRVRIAFQPRIELQNPLNISHSLAFETIADLQTFKINPRLEFFANSTTGTGIFQAINFNFNLNQVYSLVLINEGTYEEKLNKYSVSNGLSVGQALSQNNAMIYSFFIFSNNRDNYHLDSYSLSTSWFHIFYKKILDFQLTPHLDFAKTRDFKGQSGLTLQLTLNF